MLTASFFVNIYAPKSFEGSKYLYYCPDKASIPSSKKCVTVARHAKTCLFLTCYTKNLRKGLWECTLSPHSCTESTYEAAPVQPLRQDTSTTTITCWGTLRLRV